MLEREVLVLKLFSVDGLAACAVMVGEVSPLAHEPRDDAVEGGALEVELLPRAPPHAGLARAERSEVLRRPRDHVLPELDHDSAHRFAADLEVEEHPGVVHAARQSALRP